MRLRRTAAALVAAATALTIAGCTGEDKTVPSTVTAAQAGQRADQVVQEAFAQLPAGATLKLNDGRDTMSCDDGRVFAERRYLVVPGAAPWPADQAVPKLVAFWQQRGYRTHEDSRTKPTPRFVAETPDGYYAIVEAFDRGSTVDVYLSSSSPCVWENGTPDPQ